MAERFTIAPATREKLRARLGIFGPSGSGKTYTALLVAHELGKKVCVIDTEQGKAAAYTDVWKFDHLILEAPFHPERYIAAMQQAAEDHDVIVVDSITHEWEAIKEIVDAAKGRFGGNSQMAWSVGTPLHNKFVNAILASHAHVICTMRAKTDWAVETVDGKVKSRKIGLAPMQRDSIEYEFDLSAQMDVDNALTISKSNARALSPGTVYSKKAPGDDAHTREFAAAYKSWLEAGTKPKAKKTPPPPNPTPPRPEGAERSSDEDLLHVANLIKELQTEFADAPVLGGMTWEERMAIRTKEWFGKPVSALSSDEIETLIARLEKTLETLRQQASVEA